MFSPLAKLRQIFHRARGRSVEFELKPYRKLLAKIDQYEYESADDRLLKHTSSDLMTRARAGVPAEDLLVEAYALVREAARRVLGMRPFDVQMLAAIALGRGKLVQMQTGEGKTLAAVLPAYLGALGGRGVHVLTFNDYLARRDAGWMGPVYEFLGLSVGFVQQGMSLPQRRKAYASDVTYATAKEAGFDYLRDHLCLDAADLVHRALHFAIVDEADSILIDEARVPLVIAGSTEAPGTNPRAAAELVRELDGDRDFDTDTYSRNVHFTESGLDRLESELGRGDLHAAENLALLTELNLALHAAVLLRRDVDYIVREGKVELVDEFTGRVVENRRWPDGLQAAVESKEGLDLQPQGTIRGSITLQHFLRLYPKLSGMTATAQPAAEEFHEFYNLSVVVIDPHRPCVRIDHPDVVFTHKAAKNRALVREIAEVHRSERPVLVGTSSVAESEELAAGLRRAGVACRVLNARNDELEAGIVSQAGALGAVTISTNMAGRGTDIRLGGQQSSDRQKVVDLGGLYVIGTNRHESRRIDDQLRGRAGRQGDPGTSRMFISLEDDLIRRYGIQELIPPRHRPQKQDRPVDDPVVDREISRSQRIIESQTFEIRRTLWKYSSVLEDQRGKIQRRRQECLSSRVPLGLLEARAPERHAELRRSVGREVLQDVERQITLAHIDRCWAGHLAQVAEIRENIHLVVLGWQDPLDEFHKQVGRAFGGLLDSIDAGIVGTFHSAHITPSGVSLDREGLRGPASTWTYLINDNPFGSWLERAMRGIARRLKGSE